VPKVAFFTFGHLIENFGHEAVQGFVDRVPGVYGAANALEGFIARSERDMETYKHSWGEIVTPKCWGEGDLPRTAATLSEWEGIEPVAAFAYHGAHGEAMKHRNDWFIHNGLPEQTAWWIEDGETPNWQMAADRMDHLHDNGPSAFAFGLRQPFGPDGQPYKLDTARVRRLAGIA
jgi:hypothetical protein